MKILSSCYPEDDSDTKYVDIFLISKRDDTIRPNPELTSNFYYSSWSFICLSFRVKVIFLNFSADECFQTTG